MLSRPRRLAVTTAVAACLLAGCQAPTPTPSPAPSFTCTPEAGGAEFSCSQHQYDEMVAKDKLYAEAEAVYRRFMAEDVRILREGGMEEASDELNATTSGAFREDALANYESLRRRGVRASGADPTLTFFRRSPGESKSGSVISATTCVDGRALIFTQNGKSLGRGKVAEDRTYFGWVDGVLKIIGADGSQVKACV